MPGLFDPASFVGPQVGLFDRLRAMSQFQPSGVLPGQPGTQDLAGIVPQIPQQPQQQLSGAANLGGQQQPGMLDQVGQSMSGLGPALMAFAGGTLSGGIGHGLTSMAPALQQRDAQSMQMNSLQGTYQALLKLTGDPAIAKAMALNPELLKTMAPQYVAKPTFGDVGMSPTGIPIKGWINSNTQKVTDAAGNPIGGSAAAGQGPADDPSLTGAAYIDAIRSDPRFGPQKADLVQGIIAGKLPYPSGMLLKTPYGQWLQGAVSQAEPGFNAQTYQQRQKAFNDFYGGGKDQSGVQQIRQAADHGVALTGSLDRLGNYPGGALVNKPLNAIGDAIGTNTEYGPAQLNVHALADELSKIWKGGGNSDAEVRAWEAGFPTNGTPAQQRAAVGKAAELYEGGIRAMQRKHSDSFGPIASTLPPIIDPQAEQAVSTMKAWANGGAAQPARAQGQAGAPDAQGWITMPGGVRIREKP